MLIEKPFQVSTGVGALGFGDCSGWALSDDFAAALAPFRAEIDHPIRGGDQVEIVFDDQHRVAGIDQPLDDSDQPPHVRHVQPARRFVSAFRRELSLKPLNRCVTSLTRGASPPLSVGLVCPSLR